jgi:hypothetical protein
MINNNIPNPADFFNQKEIGGDRYNITALNGWDAWDGWTIIMETVAPVFGEVLDSRNIDEEVAMFEKQNTFREILTIVSLNVGKPAMRNLIATMLQGATCNGNPVDINKDFTGKAHRMMELIVHAMEVNFKGFFTESDMFQSIMGGLGKVMKDTGEE